MNNILTATEIKNYKDIGNKIDENKINGIIEQAQLIDIKALLGDRFYFDVINNLNNPIYQPLLDGCSFTYFDISYTHDGIKALLSDYFMSKYALSINTNFTPFGATTKAPQDGEIADRNSLKDISTQQTQLAGARWEIIRLYLMANTLTFPEWRNPIYSDETGITTTRTLKFRKI
jgi:hypothetical protein